MESIITKKTMTCMRIVSLTAIIHFILYNFILIVAVGVGLSGEYINFQKWTLVAIYCMEFPLLSLVRVFHAYTKGLFEIPFIRFLNPGLLLMILNSITIGFLVFAIISGLRFLKKKSNNKVAT
jgi:hypothetical protein